MKRDAEHLLSPPLATSDIKTFNRFELKYAAPIALIPELCAALDHYMTTDPNADSERGYSSHSVYCDSPDLEFFWEKIEGVKFRRKVRFRRYVGQPDAFLEIKQRISHTVQKRRIRWPLDRLREVFLSGDVAAATEEELRDPIAAELALLWRTYDLVPTMATHYRRMALQGRFDPGLRITFDTGVRYSGQLLDVAEGFEGGHPIVDPRLSIMEIKFNDRAPEWLSDLILGFDLKAMRMSKYCTGVDLDRFGGRYT